MGRGRWEAVYVGPPVGCHAELICRLTQTDTVRRANPTSGAEICRRGHFQMTTFGSRWIFIPLTKQGVAWIGTSASMLTLPRLAVRRHSPCGRVTSDPCTCQDAGIDE
jgi:hypothetical protein